MERGKPKVVVSDNSSELTSTAILTWDLHPAKHGFQFCRYSLSFKIAMICSSKKRLRFMLWSFSWARANFNLD